MTKSRVSFAHVMSFGSSSARGERRVRSCDDRADELKHDAAAHAPAIIFVTVAFGRDRSSSEGIPPVSWSDMVVSSVCKVER